MQRLSTNLTLFYKFFIPVFWIVFFGALTIACMAYEFDYVGNIPAGTFRIGVLVFYFSGLLMFAFTLLRLKRVEASDEFLYVTNYFKAARYPLHNVKYLSEYRFLWLQLVSIHFNTPGQFGKRASFVASRQQYHDFWETYPDLRPQLVKTEDDL